MEAEHVKFEEAPVGPHKCKFCGRMIRWALAYCYDCNQRRRKSLLKGSSAPNRK